MEKCRFLSFVMLLCCLLLTPPVQAQNDDGKRITMELKGETLSAALKKLEGLSGYRILFSYDDVSDYQVSGQVKNATVEAALKMILKGKPFEYIIDGQFINVSHLNKGKKKPTGGDKKITGTVLSKEDGLPVIGASVRIAGTEQGAATDLNGQFTLDVKPGTALQVSYIGMKTQTLQAMPGMEIILESDAKTLNDVVVTGIFRKAKESYTGAATKIGGEKLKMYKGQNLLQTLRNADASLNIPMNNMMGSDPNSLPQMNIRGTSSLPLSIKELNETTKQNVNTPLIIMDGFEISLTKLMDYNDEEIESITILKDASATAIYGSRGANGVIVVETKQPEPGKLKMTAIAGLSLEIPDLTSYDLLNARDKLELERLVGLYESEGKPSQTLEYQKDYQKRLKDVLSGVDTDWLNKPLRTGIGQSYNLRLEGGREEFRWGTSLSWRDTQGAMKGSSRRVFNGDITLMYTYKDLIFRNYTNIGNTLSDNSPYGSFSTYVEMQPYYRPYDDDGRLIRYFPGLHKTSNTIQNPLYDATLNTFNKSRTLGIINNFSIEWKILPELILRGQLGLSTTRLTSDIFYPAEHSMFNTKANNSSNLEIIRKGRYTYGSGEGFSYDGRLTLSYSKVFADKHQLYTGFDYSITESKSKNYSFVAEGFSSQDLPFLSNALSYASGQAPTGSEIISRRVGFTGNVNYTYDNRYFVDASYRLDGSSQFGADKRFAPFWSIGAGWNIHHERFMEPLSPVVNALRLKASYGVTGTMDFTSAAARTMYHYSSGDRYVSWNAAHLSGYGNKKLTWQDTYETNLGLEFSLFDYRISGEFNYYIRDTDGLLSSMNIPLAMGFSSYSDNVGKVRNSGFEASLNAYLIRDTRHDFSWMVNGQLVYNKNKIIKLSDAIKAQNEEFISASSSIARTQPAHLLYEGRSMYGLYVVRSQGIDPATGQEMYLDKDGNVTKRWNRQDYTYAGVDATYGSPYRGNAGTMIRWKDLTLNISFGYQWGGQTYNSTLIDRVEVTNGTIAVQNVDRRVFNDRWQKPGDRTFFKAYGDQGTYATSRFVMDDNWFDIQSVSLQYRWNSVWLQRTAKLQSILFGLNMTDLWHFSSIKYERGTSYPFARNVQGSVTFLF